MASEKGFGPIAYPVLFFGPCCLRQGYPISVHQPLVVPGEEVHHEMMGVIGQAAAHKVLVRLQQSRKIGRIAQGIIFFKQVQDGGKVFDDPSPFCQFTPFYDASAWCDADLEGSFFVVGFQTAQFLQDGVPRDLEDVHEVLERDAGLCDQHVVQ